MLKTCLNCGVEFDGSTQARFHSNACRVAYSRREVARAETPEPAHPKVAQPEVAQSGEVAQSRDVPPLLTTDPLPELPEGRVPPISLERYVRQIVHEAGAYATAVGETDKPFKLPNGEMIINRRKDRLARAERYARWRYEGFLTGEVASL